MKNKWVVLAAFWILIFSYGANWFAVAPLLTDLEKNYGIGGMQSHLLLSIIGLFVIFFAWPAGNIVDKKGPRLSVFIGSLFMVMGFGGRTLLNESYLELLFATSLAGIGFAWILVALAPQMIQWFEEKASLAIGLTSSGLFIGFGTGSVLAPHIKTYGGITTVYEFFAILAILSFLIYLIFGRDKKIMRKEKAKFMEGMKSIFSSKNALVYPFIGFFIIGTTLSASALIPKIIEGGGNVISIMVFGCAIGAFAYPYVARKYGIKKVAIIAALLSLSFWIPFYFDIKYSIYFVAAFLFGIFLQATWPIALHCQETEKGVNEKNEGIASSLYISISNMGGAILPVIIGYFSLKNGFLAILAYLLIFLVLWIIVRK